jgi:hypothetical protein
MRLQRTTWRSPSAAPCLFFPFAGMVTRYTGYKFLRGASTLADAAVWVIVAAILWPDGFQDIYRPTTQFDLQSCQREAAAVNRDWRQSGIVGLATCTAAAQDVAAR